MAKKETKTKAPVDPAKAKLSALTAAMERIEKNYGKGAIMKLGDEHVEDVDVIPHRLHRPQLGPRCRRISPRPHHRDLRSGIVR